MSIKIEIYRNKKILRCLKENRFKLNENILNIGKIIIMKIAQWSKSMKAAKVESRQKSNIHIIGVPEKKKLSNYNFYNYESIKFSEIEECEFAS